MTYREWEGALLGYLSSLSSSEKRQITEYYREMYGDRLDVGMSPDRIIAEFGSPKLCAARILMGSDGDVPEESADEPWRVYGAPERQRSTQPLHVGEAPAEKPSKANTLTPPRKRGVSVSKMVGIFFLALLIYIPLGAIIISAFAALAAVTVAGGASFIGGIVLTIAAPLGLAFGYTGATMVAVMGVGLATAGVGALLFVAFFYLTKYSAIATAKLAKYLFGGERV